MGKKKKGSVCNNPVAMARASGPPPVTGPTIRDYLSRDRPSLEEATALLGGRRKESGALAAYEEHMNDRYKEELRKHREKVLGGSSSTSGDKKKRKKWKRTERDRSRSRSPISSHHRKKSKRKHHHRRHYSSTESSSDSEEEQKITETKARGEEKTVTYHDSD